MAENALILANIHYSETFRFVKIPLLEGFQEKKQNRNFVSKLRFRFGAPSGIRTRDPLIKSGTCPFRASYAISNSMKSTIFNLITLFFKSVAHLILHLHTILFYLKSQQLFAFSHLHKFIKTCSFGIGQFHCRFCGDFSVFPIRIHLFPIVGICKCGTS